jgi:hypothetical protein
VTVGQKRVIGDSGGGHEDSQSGIGALGGNRIVVSERIPASLTSIEVSG